MTDFKFNPKISDFLEKKKDIKMLGFFWALYWRWMLLIAAVFMGIGIIMFLIEKLFFQNY